MELRYNQLSQQMVNSIENQARAEDEVRGSLKLQMQVSQAIILILSHIRLIFLIGCPTETCA